MNNYNNLLEPDRKRPDCQPSSSDGSSPLALFANGLGALTRLPDSFSTFTPSPEKQSQSTRSQSGVDITRLALLALGRRHHRRDATGPRLGVRRSALGWPGIVRYRPTSRSLRIILKNTRHEKPHDSIQKNLAFQKGIDPCKLQKDFFMHSFILR